MASKTFTIEKNNTANHFYERFYAVFLRHSSSESKSKQWCFFYWEKFLQACDEFYLWRLGRWTGWQSFYQRFLAALDCWLRKHTYTHSLTKVYTKPCPLDNLNPNALRFMSCGGGGSCLILLSWNLLAGKGCTFIPASSDATWVPVSCL